MMNDNKDNFTGKTAEFQKNLNKTVNEGLQIGLSGLQTGLETIQKGMAENSTEVAVKKHNKRSLRKMKERGEDLLITGMILGIIFSAVTIMNFPSSSALFTAFIAVAMGCMAGMGQVQKNQGKRMTKYWNILGSSAQFSIPKLADLANENKNKVYKDLDEMITMGLFLEGFVDRGNETIVLKNVEEYIQHYRSPVVAPLPPVTDSPEANAFLTEIRAINDDIDNPTLTSQITQIEMVMGKIFAFQEANQDKERELHSFFSYYLPTTLKILRAYAQLEDQNIEGANISKSKAEIEAMMVKVVEGFEKQLDQLFQHDSMDITTDIAVLEQMFEKDGLTGEVLNLNYSPKTPASRDINLKL